MELFFEDVMADAARKNVEWSREHGDFWAYNLGSVPGAYWTGYFSTNPEIKLQITQYSDLVQSVT